MDTLALAQFKDDVTQAAVRALEAFERHDREHARDREPPMFVNLPCPLATDAQLEHALSQESM